MSFFLLFLIFLLKFAFLSNATTASFRVDTATKAGPWNHFWEECVGSGHASTTLRADWQQQMTQTRLDLGFKQVFRFCRYF